jgi:hypothetical protein
VQLSLYTNENFNSDHVLSKFIILIFLLFGLCFWLVHIQQVKVKNKK